MSFFRVDNLFTLTYVYIIQTNMQRSTYELYHCCLNTDGFSFKCTTRGNIAYTCTYVLILPSEYWVYNPNWI